ncbi:hypothetical protein IJI29_02075 [Candidatus Saccharibacteria bacterium]|nr:hypothetical protein [Candidatus Saccharibacteria bacterium]MBR3253615.1 hypothetical protein [Candidatus Saccharibacteria bacterium]
MNYTFSLGWMFGGIAIIVAGGLIIIFYRQIAENLANGVSSYEKVKIVGVITVIVGFLVTANLHTFLLGLIVKLLLNR